MKVALLLPDGVGVRNFLLGSFRREAKERLSLAVFATIPDNLRDVYQDRDGASIDWYRYHVYHDTPALFMLRNTLSYAHMYSIDTWGMRCLRQLPIQGRARRRAAAQAARFAGRLASGLHGIRWLEQRMVSAVAQLPETAYYRDQFGRIQPDVLLSSNQRPYGVLPAVLAARSLGIPTATCIFSWDNLTSKGRIAAPFQHYFVWSELMRDELLRFYPETPSDCVHVVGAPQFDPHADRRLILPRAQFCEMLGADPSKPLLCYSSGDPAVQPEDPDYLTLLLELIRQHRIRGNPQVVLRPTPTADMTRFDNARRRFPELIFATPEWVAARDDWAQMLPLPADVCFLANLTHHSDVNINIASTMTLDFAIHNRPVVNVAFDLALPPPFKYPLWDHYYQFEHYRPVVETGAALFSRSVEEFVEHINLCLSNPLLYEDNRRRLVDIELGVPVGQAARRMVRELLRIAAADSPGTGASMTEAEEPAEIEWA